MVIMIVISSELNLLISIIIFSVSIVFVFVCLCFSYLFLIYNNIKQVANIKQKKPEYFFGSLLGLFTICPGLCIPDRFAYRYYTSVSSPGALDLVFGALHLFGCTLGMLFYLVVSRSGIGIVY